MIKRETIDAITQYECLCNRLVREGMVLEVEVSAEAALQTTRQDKRARKIDNPSQPPLRKKTAQKLIEIAKTNNATSSCSSAEAHHSDGAETMIALATQPKSAHNRHRIFRRLKDV